MKSMFAALRNLSSARSEASRCTRRRAAVPGLEALEARELKTAGFNATGDLVIVGTSGPDHVTVDPYGSTAIKITSNGVGQIFQLATMKRADLFFYGLDGDDSFSNNVASLRTWAWGGSGKDTLLGGSNVDHLYGEGNDDYLAGYGGKDVLDGGDDNDTLYGGNDDDALYGGAGNDKLYGEAGVDALYGQGDDDFLDDGGGWGYVDGGGGNDINAYVTVVNGTSRTDVVQTGGLTCWIDSSMAAVAQTGVNLSQRIQYIGNNYYAVQLFNYSDSANRAGLTPTTEYVRFDGTKYPVDAQVVSEGETWPLIMQRAVIQAVSRWDPSQSVQSPHEGGAKDALALITGRTPTDQNPRTLVAFEVLTQAIKLGQATVATTNPDSVNVVSSLVAKHEYTVVGTSTSYEAVQVPLLGRIYIATNYVTLRNPWGKDGATPADGNPNDGYVTITMADFSRSMGVFTTV